jgi:hypothetical protein
MAPSVSPSEHVLHPEKTSSVRVPNSSQRADFGDSGLFSYFEIAVFFGLQKKSSVVVRITQLVAHACFAVGVG